MWSYSVWSTEFPGVNGEMCAAGARNPAWPKSSASFRSHGRRAASAAAAVEEAAPFVVDEDEHAALPLRRQQERLEHVGDERGRDADVTLGMPVRTQGPVKLGSTMLKFGSVPANACSK